MKPVRAYAKINLGLVVGPVRRNGKHEIATVFQRVDLHDDVVLEAAADAELTIEGFPDDTLVRAALTALAEEAGIRTGWRVRLEKRIPVASGLGGGSSDAGAALRLANGFLTKPLSPSELGRVAARVGSDVPFFLADGTQLGTGDGSELARIALPLDFAVLLALPDGERKSATRDVYRRFDERNGAEGYGSRRAILLETLGRIKTARDLAALPRNDLASSPLAVELESLGAFRADVSGAGPVVYALFENLDTAKRAAATMKARGSVWLTHPVAGV